MAYMVACPRPELLAALPEPRGSRGVRHPLSMLLATLPVALPGGGALTRDQQA